MMIKCNGKPDLPDDTLVNVISHGHYRETAEVGQILWSRVRDYEVVDPLKAAGLDDTHETLTFHALPVDAKARKDLPIFSGFIKYFPDAMVAVAELSRKGNDQHNPGKPLFWDRSKSGDELDALSRHLLDSGTLDTDGVRHSAKVAWRAMANLQKEIERERFK